MTITKIKLLPGDVLVAKSVTGFAGSVVAGEGIVVDHAGNVYTISIDPSVLDDFQDEDLAAIADLSGTGVAVRTAESAWALRTITGTANEITVTNGDGVSGNPTISLPDHVTIAGLTITPTAGTTNQGILITQSSPDAEVQGSLDLNEIIVTSNSQMLGDTPSAEEPWNDRVATALKVRLNIGENATGFQIGQMVELWHTEETALWDDGNCDMVGFCIHAYTNAEDTTGAGNGAGFFGGTADIWAGPDAKHGDFVSFNPWSYLETGSTIRNRIAVRCQSAGDAGAQGSNIDAAIVITGNTNCWEDGIVFGDDGSLNEAVSQNLMKAHIPFTVVNGFDLSQVTFTGSILKVGSGSPATGSAVIDWQSTGQLTWTIDNASAGGGSSATGLVLRNENASGVASIGVRNDADSNNIVEFGVRGSSRTAAGDLVGNDAYIIAAQGGGITNGFIFIANTGPIRFSPGGFTERGRFTPSGGLNVGATADKAAGVINANTSVTVAGVPVPTVTETELVVSVAVNFNSANTDHAITIPTSLTNYLVRNVYVTNSGATASLTTARGGMFSATGGGGVAISADAALSLLTSNASNTAGNMTAMTLSNTVRFDRATTPTIYWRTSTAQGAAATGRAFAILVPLP